MFEKRLTKEQHQENLKKIRELLTKFFPEYKIKIEELEFFYDAKIQFRLEAGYRE